MSNTQSYLISNPQQTKYLYISPNSRIQSTTCKKFATAWNTYEKALNIINTLPSSLSSEQWIPISSISPPKPVQTTNYTINNSTVSNSTLDNTSTNAAINSLSDTPSTNDVVQYLKSLNQKQSSLSIKLNKLERETQDVLHYIEFNNLNASQGFKIYKLLHEIRNERRQVKDELNQVDAILSQTNIPQLIKNLPVINNRKYIPRELPDLFETGI